MKYSKRIHKVLRAIYNYLMFFLLVAFLVTCTTSLFISIFSSTLNFELTTENIEAFEKVIRLMKENDIGYGAINHPVDRDPVCGYVGIIKDVCPGCGRRAYEGVSVEKINEIKNCCN